MKLWRTGWASTHGHEDHIGSIPYLLQKFDLPIYGTRLTCGLIRNKLEEFGLAGKTKFVEITPKQKIKLGCFTVETPLNKVCNGLQISRDMREQLFSSLSGGEKTRVNLGRLILEDTDILLLDEPTNHLDLRAALWRVIT